MSNMDRRPGTRKKRSADGNKTAVGKRSTGGKRISTGKNKDRGYTENKNTTNFSEKKSGNFSKNNGKTYEKSEKRNVSGKRSWDNESKYDKKSSIRRESEDKFERRNNDKQDVRTNGKFGGRQSSGAKKKMADGSCPYAHSCGACEFQGVPYDKQLTIKQTMVRKLMEPFCKTSPIVGMKDPYHYRHKVHATFDCTKRGQIISGIYKEGTHEVVDIENCQIQDQEANAIIQDIKGLLRSFKIKTYDEDTGYGLLRHVLIRKGYHSKEIMVVLVLGSPILPSKNNFVKAIRAKHPEISTVVLNVNNRRTSMVLGDRNITLYGKGFIEDQLCGCTFRISPSSFYQVNPEQTEILYNKAIESAELTGKEKVIDAYCGTGTIGIIASKHAKEVIGVELNKAAIRDAATNAKRNDIKNITFYNEDAGEFMVRMASEGEKADVVIMDPPRVGSDEAFLSSVIKLGPKKIVYVSCNPETLARDLKYLVHHGYKAEGCTPVDMFPMTVHVETIVALHRTNS